MELIQKFLSFWYFSALNVISVTANQNAFWVSESKLQSPLDSNFIIQIQNLIFIFSISIQSRDLFFCWDGYTKKSFQVCNFCSMVTNITLHRSKSVSTKGQIVEQCSTIFIGYGKFLIFGLEQMISAKGFALIQWNLSSSHWLSHDCMPTKQRTSIITGFSCPKLRLTVTLKLN